MGRRAGPSSSRRVSRPTALACGHTRTAAAISKATGPVPRLPSFLASGGARADLGSRFTRDREPIGRVSSGSPAAGERGGRERRFLRMPAPPSIPPLRARTLTWALDVNVVGDGDGDGDVAVGGRVGGACHAIRMLSFQKMDVYQRAIELLALASQLSSDAPRGNSALLDQLRRAASSIPLNIAEAAGRTGQADAARTYAIARGSAMECAAAGALLVLKVIDAAAHRRGCELLERIVAMLTKLCR